MFWCRKIEELVYVFVFEGVVVVVGDSFSLVVDVRSIV